MLKIYCRGDIVSQDRAHISANDHGFLYGANLFETFRTYGGEPFLLTEHMARLLAGCRSYQIHPHDDLLIARPPSYPALRNVIRELLSQNQLTDAVIRYTLSAGEAPSGLPTAPFTSPTEVVFIRSLPDPAGKNSTRIHILRTPRTEPEVFPRPKSAHYMNSISGLRELSRRASAAGDEGLLLTLDGRLSEGTTSNIFLVSGEKLLTPSPEAHILAGITRNHVLGLAPNLDLKAREANLTLADLTAADALFITNSVRGVVPVDEVLDPDGKTVWQKPSAENRIVQKLLAALRPEPTSPCP